MRLVCSGQVGRCKSIPTLLFVVGTHTYSDVSAAAGLEKVRASLESHSAVAMPRRGRGWIGAVGHVRRHRPGEVVAYADGLEQEARRSG
jgi:hypothetical protein